MQHKILMKKDVITVALTHLTAVSITLTDIEIMFKIGGLAAALGYTLWRWIQEYKKSKKDESKNNNIHS